MVRLACHFKIFVFFMVVSLYVVVFLIKNDVTRYVQSINSQLDVLRPAPSPLSTQSEVVNTSRNASLSEEYECQVNTSAGDFKGFADLQPHIRDFLLYRHCRRFRLLLDVPQKCGVTPGDSTQVFLLLVIKTSPVNYERREVLRSTWAAERLENGAMVRRVFLAGTAAGGDQRRRTDELLRLENRRYGDILQWDFIDSFFNLTLKQLLFLDWMEERCPHVQFILNGDEDIFANTDNMVHYLQARQSPEGRQQHLYVGQLLQDTKPVRWTKSKYYIPSEVYASEKFPPYITGGGFLISGYTAHVIYNMSFTVPVIPIDDAYIGMCVEKAGLQPEAHVGVLAVGEKVVPKRIYEMDPCIYRDLILAHGFLPYELLVMWERIHSPELECGILNRY